ncbi:GPN-loop GTPase [Pancytospora philotis]|nr:GPN-loop GTPase [Pancytospora philotis]
MACTSLVVVGLAGAGKTTFCKQLHTWLTQGKDAASEDSSRVATMNLDPAVRDPKVPLDYDIRDHVDFKEMLSRHNFGPNACVNTCLNLSVMELPRFDESRFLIVDTPGQIESFVFGSPGEVLLRTLDNVRVLYVVDSSLCLDKHVFLNNMIFAASMHSKFGSPVLLLFNKSDLVDTAPLKEWVRDFEQLRKACTESESELSSRILFFEEFYKDLDCVTVSSRTGDGKQALMDWLEAPQQPEHSAAPVQ